MSLQRDCVVYGWQPQRHRPALEIARAQGVYLWDTGGRRYLDLCAGQMNVNVGHSHPHILGAMREQMEQLTYVAPNLATATRTQLAAELIRRCPHPLEYAFFTSSGAESVEAALKIARAATGRNKIYSAWRSYHGASAGASAVSGDPRRVFVEPGAAGVRFFHGATCYHCAFGFRQPPECGLACVESLKSSILLDGPETVAAVLIEPIPGTSGVYVPPRDFLRALQSFCTAHGILLIADETMTGWGRTGRWFACEHFGITPDILTTAKGITSAYVPLGAVAMTAKIRDQFLERAFVAGSTNEGHALACAAGVANIQVYEQENLIERSAQLGLHLAQRLSDIESRHPAVGDVRCLGLFACIELTSHRETRAPLADYRDRQGNIAAALTRRLLDLGVIVVAKWDYLFIAPPLVITQAELDGALDAVDEALEVADARLLQQQRAPVASEVAS